MSRLSARDRRRAVTAYLQIHDTYQRWLMIQVRKAQRRLVDDLKTNPDAQADAVDRFTDTLERAFTRFYTNVYTASQPLVRSPAKSLQYAQKGLSEATRKWIKNKVGHRITRIHESTLDQVQKWYNESNGDVGVFEDKLSNHFNEFRCRNIAVTETTSAMNASMAEISKDLSFGNKRMKRWNVCGLTNSREWHLEMDGVTIPADEKFKVHNNLGQIEEMDYPGDMSPGVSASNVCSCRCFCEYFYEGLQ